MDKKLKGKPKTTDRPKGRRFWLIRPVNAILVLLCIVLLVLLFTANRLMFYVMAPITLCIVSISIYRLLKIQADLRGMITSMGRSITDLHDASLVKFPIPTAILGDSGEIIWYNDAFKATVLKGERDVIGMQVSQVVDKELDLLLSSQGMTVSCNEGRYSCFCLKNTEHGQPVYLLYFVDVTELEETRISSIETKPVVMLALIDNYDESIGVANEGQSGRLLSDVQNILQEFADESDGFIKKLAHDRYLIMMKARSLAEVTAKRFNVLDKVREISRESSIPVTLSLGVAAVGESLSKAERDSRKALDMALGRGGDQAALKTDSGFDFFGGFSKGVEKRTKVKTRMIAGALSELIRQSDKVYVMGHKFADLDCLGSAIGMATACACFDKPVKVALDSHRNLAGCLVQKLTEAGKSDMLIHPEEALEQMTDKTLLIIVDTHIEHLLELPAVYRRSCQTVVIDHHRKMVNHIDDAVIFYHEPYASSASEMVTELIQYFGDHCKINAVVAEALLSGIMLDTRNFVIRTGVRTFEAAAYLRRVGADTVEVRKLFASSMDAYQRKTRVVASAEVYKECAVATCDFTADDLRIVAPQAADELLNISGVKASFVLYEQNERINISARSMGALNVQVIMEELGGGGHQTMAAAQLPSTTLDKAKQALLEIIDRQLSYTK